MTQKMKFAVEDIHLLNEEQIDKSQFSLLKVDCFATGKSLHETFVTEETLRRTAHTILQKPFVFAIDKRFDDLGTHQIEELPGGFVPANARIEFKTLDDGRIMMSTDVLIWKRYSNNLIDYFKRDGGKKSVSVELEVIDSKEDEKSGLLEIVDFVYTCITGLGSLIQPAIPNAQAVLSFSKEYEDDYTIEFGSRYDEVDFTIPKNVKTIVKKALELKQGSSVALAIARHLLNSEKTTPERIRQIAKFFNKKNLSEDELSFNLYGGKPSRKWALEISKLLDEADEKKLSFFSEEDEVGKNIDENKKITEDNYLGIENFSYNSSQILEVINSSLGDYKWGSDSWRKYWVESFDETYAYIHDNEDDKYYRVPYQINGSICSCDLDKKENVIRGGFELVMANENEEDKKFNYAELFADEKFSDMFAEVEEDEEEEEREEGEKESYAKAKEEFGMGMNPSAVMSAMYSAMKRMGKRFASMKAKMAKMEEDKEVYLAENAEMKQKFADQEAQQKEMAVNSFMKEMSDKVEMSEEQVSEMKEKSKEFSFDKIEDWKNHVKAFCFDFKPKKNQEENENKTFSFALGFEDVKIPQTENVWDKLTK